MGFLVLPASLTASMFPVSLVPPISTAPPALPASSTPSVSSIPPASPIPSIPSSAFAASPLSSNDKKKSQSSKPLRIDSSYPPQRSHAERQIMHVAGQQLCDTNAPASPPVGWTTESRTPNVRSQPEDATIESSAVSNGNVPSMKVGIKRSSPSSTTTNGVSAAAMPRLRAAEGPAFTCPIRSTATPPVSGTPCRQSSRIALNTLTDA